ncbi:MAG: ABC transporter substrate-binding protein [Oscillospiraceae bacterium]|jgi:peptide/nickel transport system substrate-binding protein
MVNAKKTIALLIAVMMLLTFFAGCDTAEKAKPAGQASTPMSTTPGQNQPEAQAVAETDKTLTVGTTGNCLYFYTSGSGESLNYGRRLVFDQLFEMDDNTGEISSRILSEWEWVDDVTLKAVLKDNVVFSDGTPMRGTDILFTLESYVINGHSEIQFFQKIDFEKSYVEDDGLTTYIIYSQPYGAAMSTLMIPILSEEFCKAHPDGDEAWWYSPVGSGPYKVDEMETDSYVIFERRDDYWDKDAKFPPKTIRLNFYKDPTTMYADFANGVIDIMMNVSSEQAEQIKAGEIEGACVVVQSANDVMMFIMNESSPELQDIAVREAIAYAVDWEACGVVGYGTLCMKATSHFAGTFDAYTEHNLYNYDPEKARQILADAGYKDGDIVIDFLCLEGDPVPEAFQAYLAEVGITLNVAGYDIPTLIPKMINGEGDCGMQSTVGGGGGNPAREPDKCLSTMNSTGFKLMSISDEEFNSLLAQGLATTDPALRKEAYIAADNWLYENFRAFPVCEILEAYAYGPRIAYFKQSAVGRGCLANVQFN